MTGRFWSFCHPEPGPEPCLETRNVILNLFQDQGLSNSIDRFRDLVLVLRSLTVRGILYSAAQCPMPYALCPMLYAPCPMLLLIQFDKVLRPV